MAFPCPGWRSDFQNYSNGPIEGGRSFGRGNPKKSRPPIIRDHHTPLDGWRTFPQAGTKKLVDAGVANVQFDEQRIGPHCPGIRRGVPVLAPVKVGFEPRTSGLAIIVFCPVFGIEDVVAQPRALRPGAAPVVHLQQRVINEGGLGS